MNRLSCRLLAAALFAATVPPAAADPLDDLVASQMRVSRLPGVAVAVVRNGRPIAVRTYGQADLEWRAPTTADTRFQLASATKIVTGLLLMRLAEQGRLRLDDPLTRWFPNAPAAWRTIRVRQLADHSSGLPDDLKVSGPRSVAAIVAAAAAAPLAYPPGTQSRYGTTDFIVLRAVMEKAAGKPLQALLRDELTTPLGLTTMRFADAEEADGVRLAEVIERRASTYGLRDDRVVTADFFFEPVGYGAGGLYGSIADLARLFAAIDRGEVVRPASLRELETPARLTDGRVGGFGVGWVARKYRGKAVVGHSGGPALADILRVEADRLTVIVLTNQQTFFPILAEAVLDLYLSGATDPAPIADSRAATTARVRAILMGAATASEAALAAPFASPFGRALLTGIGRLQTIELLAETRADTAGTCALERTYRVRFARRPMIWKAGLSCAGTLTALRPG